VPAAHVLQAEQLEALLVVLKLPLEQAEHVRSVVAEPSAPTNWPGAQLVQATQAVAELLSSSQVPGAHACLAATSPAQ